MAGISTSYQSALDATVVNIKSSGGRLRGLHVFNANTVSEFVQIFDALAANVTIGTTTPKMVLAIPKGASATDVGLLDQWYGEAGLEFQTAISMAATTTPTGLTSPTTPVDATVLFL